MKKLIVTLCVAASLLFGTAVMAEESKADPDMWLDAPECKMTCVQMYTFNERPNTLEWLDVDCDGEPNGVVLVQWDAVGSHPIGIMFNSDALLFIQAYEKNGGTGEWIKDCAFRKYE